MKKTNLVLVFMMIMLFAMSTSLMAQMTLEFNTNLSAGTTVTLPLYGTVDVNGKNTPIMEVDCDEYKTPTYCSPKCPAVDI